MIVWEVGNYWVERFNVEIIHWGWYIFDNLYRLRGPEKNFPFSLSFFPSPSPDLKIILI
jgi:hypothetical protein